MNLSIYLCTVVAVKYIHTVFTQMDMSVEFFHNQDIKFLNTDYIHNLCLLKCFYYFNHVIEYA